MIGRWGAVDPLAEDFKPFTPYGFTLGNPMAAVDPNGKFTLTGEAAQAFFRQLQMDWQDDDEKKKKQQSAGYLSSLGKELKNVNIVSGTVNTWTNWLGRDKSTFLTDMGFMLQNTYWSFASLIDGNTYYNFYQNQKTYWSMPAEEKAKADAQAISDVLEGALTMAPLAPISGQLSHSWAIRSPRLIENGVILKNPYFRFQYGNEPLNPIKGRGAIGSRSVPHINIQNQSINLHIIINPFDYKHFFNNPFMPFRYSNKK